MRRNELQVGSRYAGPGGRCFEVEDLSPGWRISSSGEWVEDTSTRSRHVPGRGEINYRSNLSVRAWLVDNPGTEDESPTKTTVDPRRLTEPWEMFQSRANEWEIERVHTNRLVTLLRRNLRGQPGYRPSLADAYAVSDDGGSVTLPMRDLSVLMAVAFGA